MSVKGDTVVTVVGTYYCWNYVWFIFKHMQSTTYTGQLKETGITWRFHAAQKAYYKENQGIKSAEQMICYSNQDNFQLIKTTPEVSMSPCFILYTI